MTNLQPIAEALLEVRETAARLRRIILNGWAIELGEGDDGERYKDGYGRLTLIAEHADAAEVAIERACQKVNKRVPVEIERAVRFDLCPDAAWLDLRRFWAADDAKLIGMLESIERDAWLAYGTIQIHTRRNKPKPVKQCDRSELESIVRKHTEDTENAKIIEELASITGWSVGIIQKTAAWQTHMDRKRATRKRQVYRLPEAMLVDDPEKADALQRLIEEQAADDRTNRIHAKP